MTRFHPALAAGAVRIVGCCLWLCLLAALAPPVLAQQWVEDRPPRAGYRIEMPGIPKQQMQAAPTKSRPQPTMVSSVEIDSRSFMVMYGVSLPDTVTDIETALDHGRDAVASQPGNRLREEQRVNISGFSGRRFIIDMIRTKQVMIAQFVVRNRQIYQVMYLGPAGSENSRDAQRFIASFVLLPLATTEPTQ